MYLFLSLVLLVLGFTGLPDFASSQVFPVDTAITPLEYGVPYRIRNKVHSNYVLDFAGSNLMVLKIGQPVTISRYIDDEDQYWIFHQDGRISNFFYGTCMEAKVSFKNPRVGGVVNGICTINDTTQKWVQQWEGYLTSQQYANLSIQGFQARSKSYTALRPYNAERRTEQWVFERIPGFTLSVPTINQPFALFQDFSGLALSPINTQTDNITLRLWNFELQDTTQLWIYRDDSTLINLGLLQCLSLTAGAPKVGLADCQSTDPSQQWTLTANNFVQNVNGMYLGISVTPVKGKEISVVPEWIGGNPRLGQLIKWNFVLYHY